MKFLTIYWRFPTIFWKLPEGHYILNQHSEYFPDISKNTQRYLTITTDSWVGSEAVLTIHQQI